MSYLNFPTTFVINVPNLYYLEYTKFFFETINHFFSTTYTFLYFYVRYWDTFN